MFDGLSLTYKLIVPEFGKWRKWNGEPESQCDEHWGLRPHHVEATIRNSASAFDVSSYRVRMKNQIPSGTPHSQTPEGNRLNTATETSPTTLPGPRVGTPPAWLSHPELGSSSQVRSESLPPSAQRSPTGWSTVNKQRRSKLTPRSLDRVSKANAQLQQSPCMACRRSKGKPICDRRSMMAGKTCSRCSRLHIRCQS